MKTMTSLVLLCMALIGCSASKKDADLLLVPTSDQIKVAAVATNKICPVSGDSIGAMGEAPTVIWKGQAIRLCCAGCVKPFSKDPAGFADKARSESSGP